MPRKSTSHTTQGAPASVLSRIDDMREEIVDFTSRLCAIPTVNPPGDRYGECAEALAQKLSEIHLETRVVRADPKLQRRLLPADEQYPRDNVVALWDVGATRTLHFNGHYDVVPPTAGWRTDPFAPLVRGRRLIARGAGDMKGSIASAIFAVQAMMEAGAQPPWNIELSFTPDEETGGELGLGYLVRAKEISPDAAVVCEGGAGNILGHAHRGVLWLDVMVLGRPAHASKPRDGVNALEKACVLIGDLKKLEAGFRKRPTPYRTKTRSERYPTLMVGGLSGGGTKVNVVPDRFHFTVDRRINPEERIREVERELRDTIRRARHSDQSLKVELERLLYVEPGKTEEKADICRIARAAVRRVRRQQARLRLCTGFTDMHFLTQEAGVPTVLYGCDGGGAHGDLEYVSIPDLTKTAKVYAEIAMRMPAG